VVLEIVAVVLSGAEFSLELLEGLVVQEGGLDLAALERVSRPGIVFLLELLVFVALGLSERLVFGCLFLTDGDELGGQTIADGGDFGLNGYEFLFVLLELGLTLLEPVALLHQLEPIRVACIEGLEEEVVAEVHSAHHGLLRALHYLLELIDGDGVPFREVEHQPLLVLASAAGTPGHLRVFVGSEESLAFRQVIVFAEAGEDNGLRRHIQADCKGFGGKEEFHEAFGEEDFDDFLEEGKEAGVVEGDAFQKKVPNLMVLGEGFKGLLEGMEMVIDNMIDLGGITCVQEVVLDLGGQSFASLTTEDEEERGELIATQEELEGVIELMDEGLRTDFAFHGALFTVNEFVLDLLLKVGVAVLDGFELGQIVTVDFVLEELRSSG